MIGVHTKELIAQHRYAVRRWVENGLLPSWGREWLGGRFVEASSSLELAELLSDELQLLTGDGLLSATVEDIAEAVEGKDERRLQALASGLSVYGDVIEAPESTPAAQILRDLSLCAGSLEQAGSPFRLWAQTEKVRAHYQAPDLESASRLLRKLEAELADPLDAFPALRARVAWLSALTKLYDNSPLESLALYRRALGLVEDSGEVALRAQLLARIAEIYYAIGDSEQAWSHLLEALRDEHQIVNPKERHFLSSTGTFMALNSDLLAAARLFSEQALSIAQRADVPLRQAIAHRLRAEVAEQEEQFSLAQQHLDKALEFLAELPPEIRRPVEARIRRVEGRISAKRGDPKEAVLRLGTALGLLPPGELEIYRAGLHLDVADALAVSIRKSSERSQDVDGQAPSNTRALQQREEHIEAGIAALEREMERVLRSRLRGEHETLWAGYFDFRQETYDRVIRALLDEGRDEEAFDLLERSRARELLDLFADVGSDIGGMAIENLSDAFPLRPRSVGELKGQIRPGTLIVTYRILDGDLLTWLLDSSGVWVRRQSLDLFKLERQIDMIYRAVASGTTDGALVDALADLGSLLLAPFEERLQEIDHLVFVADGPIHGVPFAALIHQSTRRFLVETHTLTTAPSATVYEWAKHRDTLIQRSNPSRALLVGNPSFETRLFPNLSDLPSAESTISELAKLYGDRATVLVAAEATPSTFLRTVRGHELVDFAGHAVVNPLMPTDSALILAPEGPNGVEHSGILKTGALIQQVMPDTRIVLLSACSTAGGQPIGSVGVSALVRPILGAGVPTVVGSLWDVRDGMTGHLQMKLHKRLRSGQPVAEALRSAQLEMLRSPSPNLSTPLAWAGFQIIGAPTSRWSAVQKSSRSAQTPED